MLTRFQGLSVVKIQDGNHDKRVYFVGVAASLDFNACKTAGEANSGVPCGSFRATILRDQMLLNSFL